MLDSVGGGGVLISLGLAIKLGRGEVLGFGGHPTKTTLKSSWPLGCFTEKTQCYA